ncbi:TetR/AcrR family transcriptional regulator [Providencia burhodogranariea]|uniref:Transcriptional repressor NemR n=1 Tax=Providencia burhodogranariea DSM 19968 TaxID=1141662 RepID=K8W9X8_9GAMM|nr:TetR/AcrR family transcriptional regulator [Providencia burhodogranariea]EKT53015.1 transcriptional repressor NemR [Providencia burhodogranariea DSM 19968]
MNRNNEHDTREHLLATGESLCIHRGFTGMGLNELLKTAKVPKGSFYHYFRSKEAFGVAMLERYYAAYCQRLASHFDSAEGNYRDRFLAYYGEMLKHSCIEGLINNCLTVKLSAEVCDLSEDMNAAMNKGVSQIITLLQKALEKGYEEKSIFFSGDALTNAQVLYSLWLGANLQAKISRNASSLESALAHVKTIIAVPSP